MAPLSYLCPLPRLTSLVIAALMKTKAPNIICQGVSIKKGHLAIETKLDDIYMYQVL